MEKAPNEKKLKFDSLESFWDYLRQLCEKEKERGGVSHFTFGQDFRPEELTEEDLEIWNLTQNYLDDEIPVGDFMDKFRTYQLGSGDKGLSFSSRGKLSSFLTNLVMNKELENLRRQGGREND